MVRCVRSSLLAAAIVTDFQVQDRNGNNRPDIAYGLADGTLVELLR